MRLKLKAKKLKAQSSKLKVFLLLVFMFQFMVLFCSPLWAESKAPKLTPSVQKVVYEAQQAIEKKEYAKAERILLTFIDKHPKTPHYLVEFTLGNALSMEGKNIDALSHYKTSADLYPDFSPAWQNLGKVCFDLKQYDQAGDYMLKAYEIAEKKDPTLLYNAAVSYIMAKEEKKALPHLEYLASGGAGNPKTEWLEALLKVCMDLHHEKKAFEVIQRLVDKNENDPRWWKVLAQFHLQQGDYEKATAALKIHSYLVPIKKQDIILMGDLYNAIGVPLKAADYYEKAVKFEKASSVYEKLAAAYIAAHKPDKALNVLNQTLVEKSTSGLLFMMGRVRYEKEDFGKAYDAFKKSAQMNPKDGQAYLMMGYCALQMHKKDAAQTAFQKATEFRDQRKQAKELLKELASL